MITAETMTRCSYLDTITLEGVLRKSYPKDTVLSSKFTGVTNGGQFCYRISYPDDGAVKHCSVFVWVDEEGFLQADY